MTNQVNNVEVLLSYSDYCKEFIAKQYQYRFKVTRIQDNKVIYTGSYTHSRELDELEKMSFLHEYTNRMLLKDLKFLNIEINKL